MVKVSKKISWEIIKKSFLSFSTLFLIIVLYILYRVRIFPIISLKVQQDFKKYFTSLFILSISFIFQKIIGAIFSWYKENIALKTDTHLDEELIPLFRRVTNILIWTIALLIILPLYGVNITALIAALGVSSLAIALAAQDTIANIIAGFMIMIDRPFRLKDKIKLPSGEVVEVLDIGIRRSKFLSQDNAIIIVPNLELSKSKIVNYSYGEEKKAQNKS